VTDILQQVTDALIYNETYFITWGPPGVLIILALIFSYASLRNWLKELFLYRTVRRLGVAALRNVVIPDGMDGRVLIENIILTSGGIYILPIKRYCGIIFAADNMDTWTQVVGKRSYKFPNPLPELETYIMAVRNLLPTVNVSGCILVTREAQFPKGKPERVIPIAEAANMLTISKDEISAQIKTAWGNLKAAGLELNVEEKRSIKHLDDGNGYAPQHVVSIGLVFAAIAWLVWRFWNPHWN
jgi:hypothetical protein